MKVRLYKTFTKRKNSTKQPGVSDSYTEVDVKLKEFTSVKNPAFALNTTDFTFEYAYIPTWSRYYFVADQISINSTTTEYTLEEDVLATNKTAIGNTVARIAFSSTGWNKDIIDVRANVECNELKYTQVESSGLNKDNAMYILGVLNGNPNGTTGAVQYYYLTYSELNKLMQNLMDNTVVQQIKNIFDNPIESIVSCLWVPYGPGGVGASENIRIGGTVFDGSGGTIAVAGLPVTNPMSDVTSGGYSTISLTIPYKWNDFRDAQPYTSGMLYLPAVGEVDLNMNDFYNSSSVNVTCKIDATTGDIIYWISNSNNIILKTIMFNGAVQIPLARVTTNAKGAITSIGGAVTSAAGVVAGIASGNPALTAGTAAGMIVSGASIAMAFNQRSTSMKGANTGRSDYASTSYTLTLICKETEDVLDANYIAQKGRPVCETHAINNHSGYVQCDNASVAIAGDAWERDEVNAFLNGGFFYE